MEEIKIEKSPSWTTVLTTMNVGKQILVNLSKRNTIAPLISRQLSLSHPDKEWKTEKRDANTFTVTRLK